MYMELCDLLKLVHNRFTYISDIEEYEESEYWVSFAEIPDGDFSGDCEDFTQAVRKELDAINEESRIGLVGVNSSVANHAVCLYNDFVIDNIHKWPMLKTDLMNYTFISASGFKPGDPWREIL